MTELQKEALQNTSQTVIDCYDFMDAFASCGVTDFTDGKYNGNQQLPYLQAQENQAEWLLDQIRCSNGSRILDIGCGNGRILQTAERRGAQAVGITISEKQVGKCKAFGLDARLMNYRNIPELWNESFDGIIANGSAEHFVQVQDAIDGKQDAIYAEMFKICYRLLKPGGRFATTIIHFNDWVDVDPREMSKGPEHFKRGTEDYHCARLAKDFGGWYPKGDQLQRCAQGYFTLESREDGTEDYHITSETWLSQFRNIAFTHPKAWAIFATRLARNPRATLGFLDDLLISQTWMRQFRDWQGKGTPTRLYRDVWKKGE